MGAAYLVTHVPAVMDTVTLTVAMDAGAVIALELVGTTRGMSCVGREREKERERDG